MLCKLAIIALAALRDFGYTLDLIVWSISIPLFVNRSLLTKGAKASPSRQTQSNVARLDKYDELSWLVDGSRWQLLMSGRSRMGLSLCRKILRSSLPVYLGKFLSLIIDV